VPVFMRYEATYGSLAAVVVLQLWLYASGFVLLLGAQLNVEMRAARSNRTACCKAPVSHDPGSESAFRRLAG
jgi:membrane protein